MVGRYTLIAAVLGMVAYGLPAGADVLVLGSGTGEQGMTCVILEETDTADMVRLKLGRSTISKSRVTSVERQSEAENQALARLWAGQPSTATPPTAPSAPSVRTDAGSTTQQAPAQPQRPPRQAGTVVIWSVGSPQSPTTPGADLSSTLAERAAKRGITLKADTFPHKGFTNILLQARAQNRGPDVLVIQSVITLLGKNRKWGEPVDFDAGVQRTLISVPGSFDSLNGEHVRGGSYLFTDSPNHEAAKALALDYPPCEVRLTEAIQWLSARELKQLEVTVEAAAELYAVCSPGGVYGGFERVADRDFRGTPCMGYVTPGGKVASVTVCDLTGVERFVLARAVVTFEAPGVAPAAFDPRAGRFVGFAGVETVLVVLRMVAYDWKVLAIAYGDAARAVIGESGQPRTRYIQDAARNAVKKRGGEYLDAWALAEVLTSGPEPKSGHPAPVVATMFERVRFGGPSSLIFVKGEPSNVAAWFRGSQRGRVWRVHADGTVVISELGR